MQSGIRHAARVLLLVLLAATAGCASFPGEKLKGAAIPDVSAKPYKPTAYIEVKFFQGNPGSSSAIEIPAGKAVGEAAVTRVLGQSSPFKSYTFNAFEQDKQDHVIRLHYYNHPAGGGAVVLGLITGFTFGVIPAAATDKYSLLVSADKTGAQPLRSDDELTTWMGIWFIPMSGKTPQKAVDATFDDLARDALRKLVESNQLRFAAPSPIATSPLQ